MKFLANSRKPKVNPFLANVSILYPLKTTENQRFSGGFLVFSWGVKWGALVRNKLKLIQRTSQQLVLLYANVGKHNHTEEFAGEIQKDDFKN